MNLFSKTIIKKLLRENRAVALKQLGQHFLIAPTIADLLIEKAQIKADDTVLEPGPGLGSLTCKIAKKAKKVIAVEKDKKMIEILEKVLKEKKIRNVKIIKNDILKIKNLKRLLKNNKNYKLIGNLPFSVGTGIVRRFLEEENPPRIMTIILQKEVAQQMTASPNKNQKTKTSRLSIFSQFYGNVRFIKTVPKSAFWPQPKVAGAILKISPNPLTLQKDQNFKEKFIKIVRAGFANKRKYLINNLVSYLNLERPVVENWLKSCSLQPWQRAETLSLQDWICLTEFAIKNNFRL